MAGPFCLDLPLRDYLVRLAEIARGVDEVPLHHPRAEAAVDGHHHGAHLGALHLVDRERIRELEGLPKGAVEVNVELKIQVRRRKDT